MLIRHSLVVLVCLAVFLFSGCSGGTPKGFPKVVSCQVAVVDGTTPIADVEVSLYPSAPTSGMVFFGKTDALGVCKVGTSFANYYKEGVPEGNYKVVLVKEPRVEDTKTREEQNAMSRPELDAYRKQMQDKRDALPRIIPVSLTTSANTTLTLDVSGKDTQLDVNVAEHK
ncbi:MAG: hypothetical protein FWD31_01740 [Planctomycetaceae bacterium]|nr:hypothetical protein [Planctomycetaceae bacterium]